MALINWNQDKIVAIHRHAEKSYFSDLKSTTKGIIKRWLWRLATMMEVNH